jgi:hypothetical protein
MTQAEAQAIVQNYLDKEWATIAPDVEIMADKTIQKEYGWIFFYQPKKYIETKKLREMLIGNCPILVKHSGETVLFPTFQPVDKSIRMYEAGEPFIPKRKSKS